MGNISEELQRIIKAKADIKKAIEDKGVTVGDINISGYADKIKDISGGEIISDIDYSTFPKIMSSMNIYVASDGTVYVSHPNSADRYLYSIKNGSATKLEVSGYGYYYFSETGDGNVYIASNNSNTKGIISVKNNVVTQIATDGYNWSLYIIGKDGTGYFGSTSSASPGIYAIKNNVATKVISGGYSFVKANFFEAKDGTIYVGASTSAGSNDRGIWSIKNNVATRLINTGYGFQYFYETSFGPIYISSNSSSFRGIYEIKNGVCTQLNNLGYQINYFYEAKDKTIYVAASNTNLTGVYQIKNSTVTQIITTGNYYTNIFEAKDGTIFISSTNSSYKGLYAIKNEVVNNIYTSAYNWNNFFISKEGINYISSTASTSPGILIVSYDSYTRLFSTGHAWTDYYQAKDGTIYVGCTVSTSNKGLLSIKNNTATQIITSGVWKLREDNIYYNDSSKQAYNPELKNYVTYKELTPTDVGQPYYVVDVHKVIPGSYTPPTPPQPKDKEIILSEGDTFDFNFKIKLKDLYDNSYFYFNVEIDDPANPGDTTTGTEIDIFWYGWDQAIQFDSLDPWGNQYDAECDGEWLYITNPSGEEYTILTILNKTFPIYEI